MAEPLVEVDYGLILDALQRVRSNWLRDARDGLLDTERPFCGEFEIVVRGKYSVDLLMVFIYSEVLRDFQFIGYREIGRRKCKTFLD